MKSSKSEPSSSCIKLWQRQRPPSTTLQIVIGLPRNQCEQQCILQCTLYSISIVARLVRTQKKIRIGYILRSADVGTLFSGRNSENSSHTCMRTPVQIYAHPRTIVHTLHTRAHPHTHTPNTHAHPSTLVHTRAHPGTPAHTCTYLRTPEHTLAHPRTPTHTHTSLTYPLITADALNLINQMNYIHLNRKMAER